MREKTACYTNMKRRAKKKIWSNSMENFSLLALSLKNYWHIIYIQKDLDEEEYWQKTKVMELVKKFKSVENF